MRGTAATSAREDSFIAEHPVVRTHPETGRKSLYVNLAHTSHFKGMTVEESAPILDYLFRTSSKTRIYVPSEMGSRYINILG